MHKIWNLHRRNGKMPDEVRKKQIEEKVSSIIEEYSISYPLFDITKFLIQEYNFQIGVQNLDKNTTGMLLVNDEEYIPGTNTNRLIVVNRDLKDDEKQFYNLKKRFIIAHEFAHFILHKNNNVQFAHRDVDKKETKEEKEADYFARCFLMPKDIMKSILGVQGVKEQDKSTKALFISRTFSVTPNKAEQRIKELGLL